MPIFLAGCISNKYNIVKYPTVKNYFRHAVIDNLKLSAQNIDLLANQDRGFRGEVYYTLGTEKAYPGNNQNYIDCVNEQLELYSEDNINILQCYIYLTEYKNRDLDETAINQLKSYFEFLKSKNIRILLRFAYEYTSNENNAAKDKQILSHLDQIGEFVNNNKQLFNDVVYAMQFGLIGLWGEGHGDGGQAQDCARSHPRYTHPSRDSSPTDLPHRGTSRLRIRPKYRLRTRLQVSVSLSG